MQEKATME